MRLWHCPLCNGETDQPEHHLRVIHRLHELVIREYVAKGTWHDYDFSKEEFLEALQEGSEKMTNTCCLDCKNFECKLFNCRDLYEKCPRKDGICYADCKDFRCKDFRGVEISFGSNEK